MLSDERCGLRKIVSNALKSFEGLSDAGIIVASDKDFIDAVTDKLVKAVDNMSRN